MLSDEQAGMLIKALLHYTTTEEDPELTDGMVRMAYAFIKAQIDRDAEKWEETCKRRSEAGKLGGRPKTATSTEEKANGFSEKQTKAKKANGFSEKQTKAKKADKDKEKEKEKEKEKDNDNDNEREKENDMHSASQLPPLEQEAYKNLVNDYGEKAVENYVGRVKTWYAEKNREPVNLYATVRKWLEQDNVPIDDHEIDKYNIVINRF